MLMALKKSKHIPFLMELAGPGYVQESIRGEKCAQQRDLCFFIVLTFVAP